MNLRKYICWLQLAELSVEILGQHKYAVSTCIRIVKPSIFVGTAITNVLNIADIWLTRIDSSFRNKSFLELVTFLWLSISAIMSARWRMG